MVENRRDMIQIKIEKLNDVRDAIIEIYKNCPHQFSDNDITSEMEKGINDVKDTIYIISRKDKK